MVAAKSALFFLFCRRVAERSAGQAATGKLVQRRDLLDRAGLAQPLPDVQLLWLWSRCVSAGAGTACGCGIARTTAARIAARRYIIIRLSPFRRLVSRECWPAALDKVSVAPYIWELQDFDLSLVLRELGFGQISFQQFLQYTDLASLRATLEGEVIYLSCSDASNTNLVAYYHADHCGQRLDRLFRTEENGGRVASRSHRAPLAQPAAPGVVRSEGTGGG